MADLHMYTAMSKENQQEKYERNRVLLNAYPYRFGLDAPCFDDLYSRFRIFPIDNNKCVLLYKTLDNQLEVQINSDKETKYFFRDLSMPLLVENEANVYNLTFLVDNVRASEDVAMDNHIYLYYSNPDILYCAMLAFDFTPLLEREKLVFLVGESEKAHYPIDFMNKYNIDYASMTPQPIRLHELNRLCFWYKHTGAGTVLAVRTLEENPYVIGCIGWSFTKFGFTYSPEVKQSMMSEETKISYKQLEQFLETDNAKLIQDIDGALEYLNKEHSNTESFTPAEAFKAYFAFRISKISATISQPLRIIPLIVFDSHEVISNAYEKIIDSFKYSTILTTFREPIVCFARNYETGWMPYWYGLRHELASEYIYTQFLNSKFFDKYYAFRFEDLKIYPEETLRAVCEHLDIPFDDKMLSVKAAMNHGGNGVVTGFDLKPLNRDISNVFSDFDIMRLKIFYAPIHKYYGYDYFDAQEHMLDDDDVMKLFSYPFRFEINRYRSQQYKYTPDELRDWLQMTLTAYYLVGKKGAFTLPKLIKPHKSKSIEEQLP